MLTAPIDPSLEAGQMFYRMKVGFDELTQQKTLGGAAAKHCGVFRCSHQT